MDIVKIIGVGIIALVIIIILKQYKPEFTMYVSLLAGVLILLMLSSQITSIIALINDISNKAMINSQFIKILIKTTGIAVLTEFAVSICKDSGETAIASKIDIGGKILIISISVPIIQALMDTVLKVLP